MAKWAPPPRWCSGTQPCAPGRQPGTRPECLSATASLCRVGPQGHRPPSGFQLRGGTGCLCWPGRRLTSLPQLRHRPVRARGAASEVAQKLLAPGTHCEPSGSTWPWGHHDGCRLATAIQILHGPRTQAWAGTGWGRDTLGQAATLPLPSLPGGRFERLPSSNTSAPGRSVPSPHARPRGVGDPELGPPE